MFEHQQLNKSNIGKYIGTNASLTNPTKALYNVPCLLQKDYGEDCDCTLTSITAIIKYLDYKLDILNIYNQVETIAKKFGYRGSYGTYNITISSVYRQSLRACGLKKCVMPRYGKNIGFNFATIQREIEARRPVLLNLWKDGRDYYKNHSVLIVGYLEKNGYRLLAVNDNWHTGISFIDYNKLCTICSIHTYS